MDDQRNVEGRLALDARREALAEAIVDRHYQLQPELATRYGPAGREKCLRDARYHLAYLAEAVWSGMPELFSDYVEWAKVMLEARGVPAQDLAQNLLVLRGVLAAELPGEVAEAVCAPVDAALELLPQLASGPPSLLSGDRPQAALARDYVDALLRGDRHRASKCILAAVERGVSVRDIYLHVFQTAQYEIGRLWQLNELSVAQEHFCTAATQLIMSQLYPHIFASKKNGRVLVAACVAEDMHEIGVRMIADFFEMAGWDTFYLGADTPLSGIVQTVVERRADVLALSATLAGHVRTITEVIAAVRSEPSCGGVKILVGGYPFNVARGLWRKVGADGFARDAQQAVELAERLPSGAARGAA